MSSDDKKGWVAFFIMAFVVAACVLMLCGCDYDYEEVAPTDRANGMPLDACTVVEYDRPVWLPDCDHAYKVYDRTTGDAWWLLMMSEDTKHEGYIVLPLDEGDR